MNDESLLIHQPTRLRIMAALSSLEPEALVEFTFLVTELGMTEGNLSVHLKKLEEAALIEVAKEFVDRKPKTWIRITEDGRAAFGRYIRELEEIVRGGAERKRSER